MTDGMEGGGGGAVGGAYDREGTGGGRWRFCSSTAVTAAAATALAAGVACHGLQLLQLQPPELKAGKHEIVVAADELLVLSPNRTLQLGRMERAIQWAQGSRSSNFLKGNQQLQHLFCSEDGNIL